MFEFMAEVNEDDTLQAARYAMRAMLHLSRQGGAKRVLVAPGEFTRRQLVLGKKLLGAVEKAAGEAVSQFDRAQVDRYVGAVYELADKPLPLDPVSDAEADRVLRLFRSYPPGTLPRSKPAPRRKPHAIPPHHRRTA